jgi:hypothetical protein
MLPAFILTSILMDGWNWTASFIAIGLIEIGGLEVDRFFLVSCSLAET